MATRADPYNIEPVAAAAAGELSVSSEQVLDCVKQPRAQSMSLRHLPTARRRLRPPSGAAAAGVEKFATSRGNSSQQHFQGAMIRKKFLTSARSAPGGTENTRLVLKAVAPNRTGTGMETSGMMSVVVTMLSLGLLVIALGLGTIVMLVALDVTWT